MSESSHIKVLVVDDEQDVAFGIRKLLKKKFQADVVVAQTAASAREHLSATPFNAVTLDYQLTDDDGLTLLAQIRSMDSPPPVLIVTGHGDENTAVKALELGAAGYVVKDTRLSALLGDAFDKLLKGVELSRAQEAIRERESEMSLILDNVPLLVARTDAEGRFLYVNAPFADLFEMAAEAFPGRHAREILGPVAYAGIESQFFAASSNEPVSCFSEITIGNDTRIFEILLVPRSNDDGKVADFFAFAGDITEKEKSQASVRMLSSLVELMPLGVDVFRLEDPEDPTSFRLIACNRAAEQISHMPRDDEVDQSILDVFPMTDRDTLDAFASSVQTGNTVEDLYNDYLAEHIPDTDYETSLVPLSGETLAVLFKDVSGRRTLKRALAASERKYRELFDSLKVGVASSDLDGRMREANPAMLELLGYTEEEFMELTHLDITPECWWAQDAAATRKVLEIGFCDAYEKEFLRKDDTTVPVEIRVCLASSDEDHEEGFWALATDISKSKRDAAELVNLNRELAGYAHTVSHDLRGPLAAINLANSALVDSLASAGDARVKEEIDDVVIDISRNLNKAYALVDNLLALAEAGQKPSRVDLVEVSDVVTDVFCEHSGQVKEKKARVTTDDDLGRLKASRVQVYQVFSNLVGNALKHGDGSPPRVKVLYLGQDVDGAHRYIVKDNGSGIPDEDRDNIFLPFFKSGKHPDTGIGLSTVKKIIDVYEGEIRAYNDGGACFEFTLRDFHVDQTTPAPEPEKAS